MLPASYSGTRTLYVGEGWGLRARAVIEVRAFPHPTERRRDVRRLELGTVYRTDPDAPPLVRPPPSQHLDECDCGRQHPRGWVCASAYRDQM